MFTEKDITWSLRSHDYMSKLDDDASLQVYALVNVEETGQKKAHQKSFEVQKPSLDLRVIIYDYDFKRLLILDNIWTTS